jgi:ankyrin repeat protein
MAIPILFALYLSFPAHQNNDSGSVDFSARQTQSFVTPLMLAAGDGTPEEVRSLIAKGIDINAKNIYGTNALMYAALAGKSENIKLLLAAGARFDDQDNEGNTALSLARQQGDQEVVALLIAAGAKDMPGKP